MAETGDKLAREVADHWEQPVNLMFLTPQGRFLTKLSTLTDLTAIHPDTSLRPGQKRDGASALTNSQVLLKHLDQYFGDNRGAVNR